MSKYGYDCLNTHNCGCGFISNKLESNCLHCGSSFIEIVNVVETKYEITPERLLGVETTQGFINKINPNIKGFVDIGYMVHDLRDLKYYISDDSDETVSFEEYVKLFYSTEDTL